MIVYIVFGLGLGDDEDHWEVCEVKLSEQGAIDLVASLTDENECEYKYEAHTAS